MGTQEGTKLLFGNAMKELMLEKPFEKITISDLCERSGVSRRSFYRYFKDKYELIEWIYDHDYLQYSQIRDDWHEWDYFPDICRFLYKERAFYGKAFAITGQNSFRDFCRERLYYLVKNDFDGILSDEEMEFFFRAQTTVLFDNMAKWLSSDPCMPPDEYSAMVQDVVKRYTGHMAEIIR